MLGRDRGRPRSRGGASVNTQSGVRLGDHHRTTTLPHRKFHADGHTYYVAAYPEGDLALHEAHSRDKTGYGGSIVTFLMEDGSYEDVRGPFSCNDLFDNGRRNRLAQHLGEAAGKQATRIVLGYHLSCCESHKRQELFSEPRLTCDPLLSRLVTAVNSLRVRGHVPSRLEAAICNRGGARIMRRDEILEAIKRSREEVPA